MEEPAAARSGSQKEKWWGIRMVTDNCGARYVLEDLIANRTHICGGMSVEEDWRRPLVRIGCKLLVCTDQRRFRYSRTASSAREGE